MGGRGEDVAGLFGDDGHGVEKEQQCDIRQVMVLKMSRMSWWLIRVENARVCQGRMPECTVALEPFSLKFCLQQLAFGIYQPASCFKLMVLTAMKKDDERRPFPRAWSRHVPARAFPAYLSSYVAFLAQVVLHSSSLTGQCDGCSLI